MNTWKIEVSHGRDVASLYGVDPRDLRFELKPNPNREGTGLFVVVSSDKLKVQREYASWPRLRWLEMFECDLRDGLYRPVR